MESHSLVDALQNRGAEKELPHLDQLDECFFLGIPVRTLKGNFEDFSNSAFKDVEIVALNVLQDAV